MLEPVKPSWLERAKETARFHKSKVLANDKWNTVMTARALRRSIGSISEDLLINRWLKTHEVQLERFKHAYEALEFIRKRKKLEDL